MVINSSYKYTAFREFYESWKITRYKGDLENSETYNRCQSEGGLVDCASSGSVLVNRYCKYLHFTDENPKRQNSKTY